MSSKQLQLYYGTSSLVLSFMVPWQCFIEGCITSPKKEKIPIKYRIRMPSCNYAMTIQHKKTNDVTLHVALNYSCKRYRHKVAEHIFLWSAATNNISTNNNCLHPSLPTHISFQQWEWYYYSVLTLFQKCISLA